MLARPSVIVQPQRNKRSGRMSWPARNCAAESFFPPAFASISIAQRILATRDNHTGVVNSDNFTCSGPNYGFDYLGLPELDQARHVDGCMHPDRG
jgi:hypothetical protein